MHASKVIAEPAVQYQYWYWIPIECVCIGKYILRESVTLGSASPSLRAALQRPRQVLPLLLINPASLLR